MLAGEPSRSLSLLPSVSHSFAGRVEMTRPFSTSRDGIGRTPTPSVGRALLRTRAPSWPRPYAVRGPTITWKTRSFPCRLQPTS